MFNLSTDHARGFLATPVLAATLVLTAWAAPAVLAAPPAAGTAAGSYRDAPASYESKILYWTNVQRRSHGVRPLRAAACADRFAESWGRHLARTGSFSHQGLTPILRTCRTRAAGENIGRGNVSARTLVAMWMRSPSHRANLLDGAYTRLGVGAAYSGSGRLYTVQDFTG